MGKVSNRLGRRGRRSAIDGAPVQASVDADLAVAIGALGTVVRMGDVIEVASTALSPCQVVDGCR